MDGQSLRISSRRMNLLLIPRIQSVRLTMVSRSKIRRNPYYSIQLVRKQHFLKLQSQVERFTLVLMLSSSCCYFELGLYQYSGVMWMNSPELLPLMGQYAVIRMPMGFSLLMATISMVTGSWQFSKLRNFLKKHLEVIGTSEMAFSSKISSWSYIKGFWQIFKLYFCKMISEKAAAYFLDCLRLIAKSLRKFWGEQRTVPLAQSYPEGIYVLKVFFTLISQ